MSVVEAPTTNRSGAWDRFWFRPVPAARAEVFRRLCAAFVALDLLFIHSFLGQHGSDDTELYQPLLVGRVLPLPVPTDLVVWTVAFVVLGCSTLTLAGRANRLVGVGLALGYLQWLIIDFSYGKVDHDRFPIVLALFVLASLRPTSLHDRRPSTTAGWVLRCVQVGVVSVYFLSAVAKVRYGGWLWANSATLTQALVRRGTSFGRSLLDTPNVLVAAQWAAVVFELASPLMLRRTRLGMAMVTVAIGFHVVTWSMLTIGFYPQVLCLTAFFPLERMVPDATDGAHAS